jgi:hypothetical protein
MRPEDIKALMRLGVPLAAIETLCAAPVRIILGRTAELYEPHETGIPAWLRPRCFFEERGLPLQRASGACTGQRTLAAGLYTRNERR